MKDREIAMLERHLDRVAGGAGHYLEFGSGNSTRLAASRKGIARIHVVESDPEFFSSQVRVDPAVDSALGEGRLEVSFANLGPISHWGHPEDESHKHLWPLYPLGAFSSEVRWNLILVDGRFRVACCLAAALSGLAGEDSPVLVHDFHHRPHYRLLLRWLRIDEEAETLVSLKRREDFDAATARTALQRYVWLQDDHTFRSRIAGSLRKKIRRLVGRR